MSESLSQSEQLLYNTVRIECVLKNGGRSTGTGFFFKFTHPSEPHLHIPTIVSNKHVIAGAETGTFHLALARSEWLPLQGGYETVSLENFEARWIPHPDPQVDLAILFIGPIFDEIDTRGKTVFYRGVSASVMPSQEQAANLLAIEDILMVGYPNGIWDRSNNFPIARRGITATNPNVDYNGKKEFLIDAACFPGSSGSPVFIYNPGGFIDRKGNQTLATRVLFLGVLYAGTQHSVTGDLEIVEVPSVQSTHVISYIPNNIGVVIKAERILEFQPIINSIMTVR